MVDTFTNIQEILSEILDIEPDEVSEDTYVIRDLGAESIDLLELAVALNTAFKSGLKSEIIDDEIFLRFLREYMTEADQAGKEHAGYLKEKYPFFSETRIDEMLSDLSSGPVLKVSDLIDYIHSRSIAV